MKNAAQIMETCIAHIERDHGGCDQNTCTLSVALRMGYHKVAIDCWIGCGAMAKDFPSTIPFSLKAISIERKKMIREVPHTNCGNCNALIWLPDEVTNAGKLYCDSCGKTSEPKTTNRKCNHVR